MEDAQSPREANKICGVCGDRALGYNFNAVSCESCKAFFRRNALKNKDFRCPFTENCNVTPVTRRFCQKCRLDKCFSIGMRKEYIMTEEDKVLKRQKIEQNRAKKRPTSDTPKTAKMKRDLDDSNCDMAVSLSSVTSVASTVSESYFWEADRKYTELDSNKQTIESMSPVTAASVPSPSSPESRDIIGSKTLEMQKARETPGSSYLAEQQGYESSKVSLESPTDSASDASFSPREIPSDVPVFEGRGSCSIPKENCSKSGQVMSKLQKPNFILKLIKNPHLVAKIFQEKSLVSKLADDPTFTKLIAENEFDESLESSNLSRDISDNVIEDMLCAGPSINENPILTDLISKNPNDCGSKKASSGRQSTDDVTKDVVQDVQRIPVAANSIESILCEAIKLEFSAYSTLGGNHNSRELNDAERAKLNELIVANKALLAPLDDDITNLVGDECRFKGKSGQSDPMLLDVINLTAIAIRRLIKMSKKINAFKNMCQDDQLALLKGGCTEMMILRSAWSYDPDKDMWKIPHSQESMSKIKVDVLKEAKGNLYAEHAKFVRTFDPRWRDENIILILSAIALFTPDRPRVVHSDVIKLEQNSYYYLLRRYLESVYPGCEAKSTFLKLIQKISELHRLNNEVVGVYLNVNPSSVEPLLIEIFDLKH